MVLIDKMQSSQNLNNFLSEFDFNYQMHHTKEQSELHFGNLHLKMSSVDKWLKKSTFELNSLYHESLNFVSRTGNRILDLLEITITGLALCTASEDRPV